jgi:hypothetical protein
MMMQVPLTSASSNLNTATLHYDSLCHGLVLDLPTLQLTSADDACQTTELLVGGKYMCVPQWVFIVDPSLFKVVADYCVWNATQNAPEQLSHTANPHLKTYFDCYTHFGFTIDKVEHHNGPKNECEGSCCLKGDNLLELVHVTFTYECHTLDCKEDCKQRHTNVLISYRLPPT